MTELSSVSLTCLIALLVNVPLGYWRSKVRKFSLKWFFAVHLSVPFIIFLRVATGVSLIWIPITISSAVIGQFLGGYIEII